MYFLISSSTTDGRTVCLSGYAVHKMACPMSTCQSKRFLWVFVSRCASECETDGAWRGSVVCPCTNRPDLLRTSMQKHPWSGWSSTDYKTANCKAAPSTKVQVLIILTLLTTLSSWGQHRTLWWSAVHDMTPAEKLFTIQIPLQRKDFLTSHTFKTEDRHFDKLVQWESESMHEINRVCWTWQLSCENLQCKTHIAVTYVVNCFLSHQNLKLQPILDASF